MTAPQTMATSQRFMSTEVVRNIDQIKDITVTPNNSAG
jgi:NADH dehydrogenase (ubiquinone) Fe-S protein 7